MRPLHVARLAALGVAVALAAGCGSAAKMTAPAVTDLNSSQALQVAQQVSLSMMIGNDVPVSLSTTQPWSRAVAAPLRMARPTTLDTTITGDGVTWQISAHAYDVDGNEQTEPDPLTVYRLSLASWLHGAWSDSTGNAHIGSRSTLDLRGVGARWDSTSTNGSRSDTLQYALAADSVSASYRSLGSASLVNVIRQKPLDANPYPLSGAVNWQLQIDASRVSPTHSEEQHWIATAVVTFDGTHLARLVINGTHVFTLDLDTGEVTPVVS